MPFANPTQYIWLDGKFVTWDQAQIHCLTHTLHYGLGVLEGVRAYATENGPAIFKLREHTARLFRSAKILNLPISYTEAELNLAQQDILRKNNLSHAYIRPLVFYGADHLSLSTANLTSHVMIAAWQPAHFFKPDALANGIKVRISSYTRNHVNSVLCKAKANGNYLNSILALQEAQACGCDEALFLDQHGYIAEGSGENFFMVRDNILYTPELTAVLEGITRATIIQLAQDHHLIVKEKNITRDEVYIADEAFFTGTSAEVTPICEIDGRSIGNKQPGPITRQLQETYSNQVHGKRREYLDWLTLI